MMEDTVVIRNCRFVKELTEGTELTHGDLLFKGDRIEKIAPCGTVFSGVDEEFDAKGMTALPGIIDAHIHLTMTHDLAAESSFVDPCSRAFENVQYAQYLMSIGITTVRDCGEDKYFSVIALRNAINAGIIKGPRIICCGLTLVPTETGCLPSGEFGYMTPFNVDGADSMRAAARGNLAHGADFVKLYGTGSMMAKGSRPEIPIMQDDEILEAVKVAKQKETYCAIHCHSAKAIDQALRCGVSTIEHASFIDEPSLERLAGRTDCGIVPTLSLDVDITEHTDPNTDYGKFVITKVKVLMEQIKRCLGRAYERGDILIGWGTDQAMSAYMREPGSEFRARHEFLGWGNLDLLKQATINSAKLIRMDNEIGTIKAGKCADVILVDGDPVKDISVMYKGAAHVFHAGKRYK
jgi:imidazolonepropionase-like amidohydrolase